VLLALVAGLAVWFVAGVAPAANGNRASATGFVVQVKIPGSDGASAGYASAPPAASASGSGFSYPADGSVVTVGTANASAKTGPGAAAHASASATVNRVSLFGGEVNIQTIALAASADADSSGANGDLSHSSVAGLAVDGTGIAVGPNERVSLGSWGYAVALEQAVQEGDGPGPGTRVFVTGLHVYLTANHGGLPAGSEILVGYAEAAAEMPASPAEPSSGGSGGNGSAGSGSGSSGGSGGGDHGNDGGTRDPKPLPPGAPGNQPSIVRNPPANVKPDITGAGYVFPVYGQASFSDDFGSPRSDTIWHHGQDIFAALGTPVLAVADGTLFMVGWNHLGGQRLWLRDTQGNEYYYAHLSAYSPLAVDGAHVKAGDVIAFVGNTGDAMGTPYHLHFEIHPKALLGLGYDGVINPFPYLTAWYANRDESFPATVAAQVGQAAAEPGAVVLEENDISTVSGLDQEALERALELPAVIEGIAVAQPAANPALVGSRPGFAS